ncbi:MAG: translocation/assembly module TamB domain-containing protein [Deltaproteobacteria bacterium]|nr:translocation/assembly module TamB domain-containing protein [Deltaproteobacteria bacterium]MBW1795022.1 translocation/assembly module TamB domain-containing protein [Deltaproteobacteria bacterium]
MSWKSHIKQIVKWLAVSMGALLVLLSVLFGLVQTQAGKRQVATLLSAALSRGIEGQVILGKLEGLIPFHVRLDHLGVGDEGGGWLTVEDVIMDWSATSLVKGRLRFAELSAGAIKITRVPQEREPKKVTKTGPSAWLKILPFLVVDRFAVGRLTLGPGVIGESIEAKFSGAMFRSQVALSLKLRGLKIGKLRAGRVEGNLSVDFLGHIASPFPGLRVSGNGMADELAYQGLECLPERHVIWSLAAQGPVNDVISVGKLQLTGETLTLAVSGCVDTRDLTGKAEAVLEIDDLMSLSGSLGFELPGKTRLHASFEGDGQIHSFSASVRGQMNIPSQGPSVFTAMLAPEVLYAANVNLTEGTKLTISDLRLEAPAVNLTAETSLDLSNNALSGCWQLTLPQLHTLSQTLKHRLGGSLQMEGEIGGFLKMAKLTMKARGNDILIGGVSFQQIGLTLLAEGSPGRTHGNLRLDLQQAEHRLHGMTDFILEGQHLTLFPIRMQACGSELAGELSLDLDRLLAEGNLEGRCKDLSSFSVLLGEKLGGKASLQMRFEPSEARQNVAIQLVGTDLATPFGYASEVRLDACLTDAFKTLRGTAEIQIEAFQHEELTLSTFVLSAGGDPEHITFTGRAGGHYNAAFGMEIQGMLGVSREGEWLKLKRFQGRYGDFPVALARPVTVRHTSKGYGLDELALNFGSGHLEASGSFADEHLNVAVDFERLPLAVLRLASAPDLAGSVAGHVVATGKPDQPEGRVELDFTGVRLRDSNFPQATLAAEAKLQEGRLHAKLALKGLGEKPMEARLDLPVALSLVPFGFSLPPKGLLKGRLVGEANLAWAGPLLALDDQSLDGCLELMCLLKGTVGTPEMTGRAHLEKGVYENARTGMILRDLDVRLVTKGSRLIVERAQGTDGENGIVSLQGWVDLSLDEHFPFQLDFILEEATLLRLDEATATAEGRLTLSGSLREALIAGKLDIGPAELRIPDRLPPEMTELEVIEIDRGMQEKHKQPPPQPGLAPRLLLDVALESPGRVFLRGRGLDSELAGDVRITGSAHEPVITGRLSVVRGYFNFLGERFSLEKGVLSFDGSVPAAPYLDVTAEARAGDITALVQLSGPASAPEVSLTSNPALPSDEILARLLFGRSVDEITPIQAVRLAYAASILAGSGSGWDLMGCVRDLLGVDQLEIKQSEEESGEVSIGVGKYLGERVYLEVEQGLGPGGAKGTVEVEITPNITVETEVGGESDAGIGIRWKRDY